MKKYLNIHSAAPPRRSTMPRCSMPMVFLMKMPATLTESEMSRNIAITATACVVMLGNGQWTELGITVVSTSVATSPKALQAIMPST